MTTSATAVSPSQDTEFGHVAPDRVDERDPLARQELVRGRPARPAARPS